MAGFGLASYVENMKPIAGDDATSIYYLAPGSIGEVEFFPPLA